MLLMIDNYDSFTYNLVQYFGRGPSCSDSIGAAFSRSMAALQSCECLRALIVVRAAKDDVLPCAIRLEQAQCDACQFSAPGPVGQSAQILCEVFPFQ